MHLTKSLFVDFCDYPKLARRKANNPEVYKKIRKIETEEQEDHIMAIGQAVEDNVKKLLEKRYGMPALDLMPHFHKLKNEETDDDDDILPKAELDLPKALHDTLQAIHAQQPILYQPTFQYGECLVRADFMVWNGTGYDLIEAKAKSWIRKEVTDDGEKKAIWAIEENFKNDVSFQLYVINNVLAEHTLGQIHNVYFAYLNKEYIKQWPLDIHLLLIQDKAGDKKELEVIQRNKPTKVIVDDRLLSSEDIASKITALKIYISLSEEEANKQFLWSWTKYLEYFWEDKPFWTVMGMGIHHSNASYVQDLFYQGKHHITMLTEEETDGFNANGQNFINKYLEVKHQGKALVDTYKIAEVFSTFSYPICFYDYETISIPVPMLDNTRPYMQTVVQYSLHKYYEDGTMKHYGGIFVGEWAFSKEIIEITDNPNQVEYECEQVVTWSFKDLLQLFLDNIWDDLLTSTFVVRHESFENSRNKDIAKLFPDLADSYLAINERTYDLKKIVSEGYFFDIACKGSASIKKVLPVLVPEMTYDGMDIWRGDIAMRALHQIITWTMQGAERQKAIKDLLIYCWQDTLAMVRIFETLKKMI